MKLEKDFGQYGGQYVPERNMKNIALQMNLKMSLCII